MFLHVVVFQVFYQLDFWISQGPAVAPGGLVHIDTGHAGKSLNWSCSESYHKAESALWSSQNKLGWESCEELPQENKRSII